MLELYWKLQQQSSAMAQESVDFVDRIYEAAVLGELWPNVLQELATLAGARGSILLAANPHSARWVASAGVHQLTSDWFREGWAHKNTRGTLLHKARSAGFLREIDIYESRHALESDPQIKEFFRPRGFGWGAGTIISVPNGDNLIFSIEREFDKGPVEDEAVCRLDMVRPHLARAALLSARLGFERARAMAQAMEAIGVPAAILRTGGRFIATNPLFEKLMPTIIADRRNRLMLVNPESDRLFENALAKLDHGIKRGEVLSIAVPAAGEYSPIALHLVPVCGMAHDIFSQAASILIATPVDKHVSPDAALLEGLFDLTPAEAKVARAIADAKSIGQIARRNGVSANTIRNQLRAIFAKTGTGRQTELVRLLTGSALNVRAE